MKSICDIDVWSIIDPIASSNDVLNPSGETTGNFSARNAATISRVTTYQYRGLYCYRVQTSLPDEGIHLTLSTLTNAIHWLTFQARGRFPEIWTASFDNTNWRKPRKIKSDNGWIFYGIPFPADQANGSTTLRIRQNSGDNGDFYIDCVQVEPLTRWSTYIDGDESGCLWTGTAHASRSTRSAQSRQGGLVKPIASTYDLAIELWDGTGMVPIDYNYSPQALLPGEITQSYKIKPRPITFSMQVPAVEPKEVQKRLGPLMNVVAPNRVSPHQPFRLRYTGGAKELEIACDYDTGLDGGFEWRKTTRVPLKVIAADDPFFYEIPETGVSLTTKQNLANADNIVAKLDGVWAALSGGVDNGVIYAMARGADGTIYVGGSFTTVDGGAISRIAAWNPATSTWSALGTGAADNTVYALLVGPDGALYAGGTFTQMGGVANTKGIAKWSGGVWSSIAGADIANGSVNIRALLVAQNGLLWVGGVFIDGGTSYRLATWDGATWTLITTGLSELIIYALKQVPSGLIYAGGDFVLADRGIIVYDGSTWAVVGSGTSGGGDVVYSIAVGQDGTLYIGGNFTAVGGVSVVNVAMWNGTIWSAMSDGLGTAGPGTDVNDLTIDSLTGLLYASGSFFTSGSLTLPDGMAVWNGSRWSQLDIDLPGAPAVEAFLLVSNGFYLGYGTQGTAIISGATTITNNGSYDAYPKIVIKRSGGTTAKIMWIKNETTGKTMLIDYDMLDGETISINLQPRAKSVISDVFGNVIGRTLLPMSDFSTWSLVSGSNDLTVFVVDTGAPTMTAYMLFRPAHIALETALP